MKGICKGVKDKEAVQKSTVWRPLSNAAAPLRCSQLAPEKATESRYEGKHSMMRQYDILLHKDVESNPMSCGQVHRVDVYTQEFFKLQPCIVFKQHLGAAVN